MPKIDILPATASVQEMQRNYRKLLDKVKSSRRPLFLLRNNFPEAVIVDVQSWEELASRVVAQEEAAAQAAVEAFDKAKREGKLKVLRGSLTDLMD
ncbi:MAG: type II toxin-antitoxin system Phd/YefM family antitoxin [Patescibacteria group bacterium]